MRSLIFVLCFAVGIYCGFKIADRFVKKSQIVEEQKSNDTYYIQSKRGSDGYIIEQAEFMHTDIHLRIHMFRSEKEFKAAKISNGVKDPPNAETMAFTYSNKNSNECEIYMYDPAYIYEPEYIGHELVHCIYGDFHPTQDVGRTDDKVSDKQ